MRTLRIEIQLSDSFQSVTTEVDGKSDQITTGLEGLTPGQLVGLAISKAIEASEDWKPERPKAQKPPAGE